MTKTEPSTCTSTGTGSRLIVFLAFLTMAQTYGFTTPYKFTKSASQLTFLPIGTEQRARLQFILSMTYDNTDETDTPVVSYPDEPEK